MTHSEIAILLPSREGFSPNHFGAISLCVRDFVQFSRYKDRCRVYGAVTPLGFEGIHYQHLPAKRSLFCSRSRNYLKAFLAAIQERQPALVEIHNRPTQVLELKKHWSGPIALHLHNDPQKMKYGATPAQRQRLIDQCAAIYCVSDYIRNQLLDGVSDPEGKAQTIYNGLSISTQECEKQKQIVYIGRLQPEKGALEFVQALQITLAKEKDWSGILIGSARHDPESLKNPYERQIQQILRDTTLPIEMRGFCSHTSAMQTLAESEIAVVPSVWHESFGRTALEAMASGCATVSSYRGGIAEVVEDATLHLHEITAQSIADALHTLIHDETLRKTYQSRARVRANHFDISKCTATLDDVRGKLLAD